MTDLSPLPTSVQGDSPADSDDPSLEVAVVEDTVLVDNKNPRFIPGKSPRSSKRANSSSSVSHRQKFRSKLDSLTSLTHSLDPFQDTRPTGLQDSNLNSNSNYTSSTPQILRYDSRGSVSDKVPQVSNNEKLQSPLDYLWANADLDALFPIKLINQIQMKSIINMHYSQQLPECDLVFPWLHGIHHSNNNQRDFLNSLSNFTSVARNNFDIFQNQSKIPAHYRGLIPVQSGFIPSEKRITSGILKGTIFPTEILKELNISSEDLLISLKQFLEDLQIKHDAEDYEKILNTLLNDCITLRLTPVFKNLDPEKGISLRNFNIQVSKLAQISDFIVYCFNEGHLSENGCNCASVGRLLYFAQLKHAVDNPELVDLLCSTLILQKNDEEFYKSKENSKLLAAESLSRLDSIPPDGSICSTADLKSFTNWENNYLLREKIEISKMSSATETLENIWVGNTSNYESLKTKGFNKDDQKKVKSEIPLYIDPSNSTLLVSQEEILSKQEDSLINLPAADWKIFVSCSEGLSFPSINTLRELLTEDYEPEGDIHLDFPPSGSIGMGDCTDTDLISIINTCKFLYTRSSAATPLLIYCSDGYTESSLLVVLFLIYTTGKSLTEVIIDLHKVYSRPFFLFPTDVQLISKIEDILIHYSPTGKNFASRYDLEILSDSIIYKYLFLSKERTWFLRLNGSLPSRILPHLYLGSLNHANEFELLKEFNIKRIVSVGENLSWLESQDSVSGNGVRERIVNDNITVLSNFQEECPVTELMSVNNVQDDGIDMLTHNLRDILDFINEGYEKNEPVLVHCRVGVSRSATVCIAEVMRRLQINLIKAYIFVRVRRLNIIIQPNLRFMYELVKWEESERLRSKQRKLSFNIHGSSGSGITEIQKLGSPMKSSFDSDAHPLEGEGNDEDNDNDDDNDDQFYEGKIISKNLESANITLSESIGSLLSEFSDSTEFSVANLLEFREKNTVAVPLRQVEPSSSPVHEKAEVSKSLSDNRQEDGTSHEDELSDEVWLRDVDWHILCREIDTLNKVYIRV